MYICIVFVTFRLQIIVVGSMVYFFNKPQKKLISTGSSANCIINIITTLQLLENKH